MKVLPISRNPLKKSKRRFKSSDEILKMKTRATETYQFKYIKNDKNLEIK